MKSPNGLFFLFQRILLYVTIGVDLGGVIMNIPIIQGVIEEDSKSSANRRILFDKVNVFIFGKVSNLRTQITFRINKDCRKDEIHLEDYIHAVNIYLMSNPAYKIDGEKVANVFDFNLIKWIDFKDLNINKEAMAIIKNCYPNLLSINLFNANVEKGTSLRLLKSNFYMDGGSVFSLDFINGFEGEIFSLQGTKVLADNQNTIHLYCKMLKFTNITMDYERFFLTTDASKLLKLEIIQEKSKNRLTHKDLLFISGFFNLKSIIIDGVVENYDQVRKLECLHELKRLLCTNLKEMEKTKKKRRKNIEEIQQLKNKRISIEDYLLFQTMASQNSYLDFFQKIYVPRLERVKWEEKIRTRELEKIKEGLLSIVSMSRKDRKDIARSKEEYTIFEEMNDLCFDHSKEEEEYIERDANPFSFDPTVPKRKYYVKNKKIIIDE